MIGSSLDFEVKMIIKCMATEAVYVTLYNKNGDEPYGKVIQCDYNTITLENGDTYTYNWNDVECCDIH